MRFYCTSKLVINHFLCLSTLVFLICCKKSVSASSNVNNTDTTKFSVLDSTIKANDSTVYYSNVFSNGESGYNVFRIPAIIKAKDSTLLAFCEARDKYSDFGCIKIVLKRSVDFGKTWFGFSVVAQNGNLTAGNPTPVIDFSDTRYPQGRIFLFYRTANKSEDEIKAENGVNEIWFITSTDLGYTWSTPKNITLQVHHPYQPAFNSLYTDSLHWTYFALGPGHALQTTEGSKAGRLVIPINHSIYNVGNYASCFFSDDHGLTFKLGADIDMQTSENAIAELPNGGIIFNCRNYYIPNIKKRILYSDTLGLLTNKHNWFGSFQSDLIDPNCQGSMINLTTLTHNKVLLFANPQSDDSRVNLAIKQSNNWGKKWSNGYLISDKCGYSDIVVIHNNRLGVIYEDDASPNTIKFSSFPYSKIPKQ